MFSYSDLELLYAKIDLAFGNLHANLQHSFLSFKVMNTF
jgi:hypothetical protein